MEISLSRFAQLTAMLAAGGTLLTACTVNNIHQDAGTGGAAGTLAGTGGASGTSPSTLATGGSTNSSGGATSTGTAEAGATSTAGSSGVGGGTSTSTGVAVGGGTSVSTSTASIGGAGGSSTMSTDTTGGLPSTATSSTSVAATGGVPGTSTESTTTVVAATGGLPGTSSSSTEAAVGGAGGGTAAVGGATGTTVGVGGGTSTTCVSGDPAAEGMGFDCSTLSYYGEMCPDPSGEGELTYGAQWCRVYANERVDAVKLFTDCLAGLTQPTTGWCGAEHKAAVDACRSQMLTKTCPSTAAQTACASIGASCSSVTVANCVADLSPLSDTALATVEPCMEGATSSDCDIAYKYCADYPDQSLSVAATCAQLQQNCSEIDLSTCEAALDINETGYISYYSDYVGLSICLKAVEALGYPCAEGLMACLEM